MQEVLFKVGTIVDIVNETNEETEQYLIIGKRQYNPNSGNSWDYVGVPIGDGYKMNCKTESPYDNNNLYFFNHTDIQSEIKENKN